MSWLAPVGALPALLLACTPAPPAPSPVTASGDQPTATVSTTAPSPPDAGEAADGGAEGTLVAVQSPAPFALPPVPRFRGEPSLRTPSRYLTKQFFQDCARPTPVSGWAGPEGAWSVTAYRCEAAIPERRTPDPWPSDGTNFLWASRGTLVLEVVSRMHDGPSAAEWRAYLTRTIRAEPGPPPEQDPLAHVRVDRRALRPFLSRVRLRVATAGGGACASEGREYEALGKELDRLQPGAPGILEVTLMAAAKCIACGHAGGGHTSLECLRALDALDGADAWVDRHAR